MTDDQERLFTLEEAQALLPEVAPLVHELREAHTAMEARQDDVLTSIPTNGGGPVHREFLQASVRAASALDRLNELGLVVRDPASGLVDFPSVREGEQIYLCWRIGEEQIGWWHPPGTGFAGRKPL